MKKPPVVPPRRAVRVVAWRGALTAAVALLALLGMSVVAGAQTTEAAEARIPVSASGDGAGSSAQTEEAVGAAAPGSRARSARGARSQGVRPGAAGPRKGCPRVLPPVSPSSAGRRVVLRC
ncbi:hypothetical protein [Streptomyces sp. NPDC058953]|uniref:hypothetical protein n=1 Tax=unclassified Streptomyces TaxID=2593676 RepID=UPI003686F999